VHAVHAVQGSGLSCCVQLAAAGIVTRCLLSCKGHPVFQALAASATCSLPQCPLPMGHLAFFSIWSRTAAIVFTYYCPSLCAPQGRPIFAFSTMSPHTADVKKDPRCSITIMAEPFRVGGSGVICFFCSVQLRCPSRCIKTWLCSITIMAEPFRVGGLLHCSLDPQLAAELPPLLLPPPPMPPRYVARACAWCYHSS